MIVTGFLVLSTIVAIYLYLRHPFSYWKKRGVWSPKPNLFYGNFPSILMYRNSNLDYLDLYQQYKDKERFIGVYFARVPQLLILDHTLVKRVFVDNFKNFHDSEFANWFNLDPIWQRNPVFRKGEEWKTKRAEIVPALTTTKLKSMYPIMQATSEKLTKYIEKIQLEEDLKHGVEAKEIMVRFLVENMTNCLYGLEAGAFTKDCPIRHQIALFVANFFKMINYHFITRMFPLAGKLLTAPLMPKSVEKFFISLIEQVVEHRKSTQTPRFDLLHFFMQTKERKSLSDIDLVGHVMTFMFDGVETTSMALSSCLHMLARNQHCQTKLREEVQKAFDENGELSFETICDLPYLDGVVCETLRMFIPGGYTIRVCTESCEFEDSKGKKIPIYKDEQVVLPALGIHYDEEFYKDPLKFDPDRFDPETGGVKKYRDMGVFLPFGLGPRMCLGMRLGILQMKVAVAGLVKNWEIRLNPRTQDKIDFEPNIVFLMHKGGVWLDFKKIN